MGGCCSLSTFHWCPCCCSVPVAEEKVPLLSKSLPNVSRYSHETATSLYEVIGVDCHEVHSQNRSSIRIVTLSDSHMNHNKYDMPEGDILIMAGDWTNWRTSQQNIPHVVKWLGTLDKYQYKIIIAGNHERGLDEDAVEKNKKYFLENCNSHYLQDEMISVLGLNIYGTPWHPQRGCLFSAHAFDKSLDDIKKTFESIPDNVHILVTHSPPYGLGDLERPGHVGSSVLLNEVTKRVKPYIHVYGHSHGGRGVRMADDCRTVFVNTACSPTVLDLLFENEEKTGEHAKTD